MSEFKIYTEEENDFNLLQKEVIDELKEDEIMLSSKDYFNILIAQFMGGVYEQWRSIAYPTKYCWEDIEGHKDARRHYDLKYDSSWEWLMPVIFKIGTIPVDVNNPEVIMNRFYPITFGMPTDDGKEYMFRFFSCQLHKGDTVMEAAYNAVIDFIKDYNKNKC